MCRQIEVYDKDADYLDKLKDKLELRSKAAVVRLIIKTIKQHKMEGELR